MDRDAPILLLVAVVLVGGVFLLSRRKAAPPAAYPPGFYPPPIRPAGAAAPGPGAKSNLVGTIATGACVGAAVYYSAGTALPLCGLAAPFATGAVHVGENIVKEIGSWF